MWLEGEAALAVSSLRMCGASGGADKGSVLEALNDIH